MMRWNIDQSWTLFLDRDGVVNKRNFDGYITDCNQFEFEINALKGIAKLSVFFHRTIVVTNQQGIGKKLMTECNLEAIHRYMLSHILDNNGRIDAVFVAANLKGAAVDRRKPNPAMGIEAQGKFPSIDFKKSIMVGDTDSDLLFGMNLGMKTVLVKSKEKTTLKPDLEVNDLLELVEMLNINYV